MSYILLRVVHVCFFTYVLLLIVLYFAQRTLIYHPNTAHPLPIEGVEVVNVETVDNLHLQGWYIFSGNAEALTILFFHGNAGHYGDRIQKAIEYSARGYNVLLAGYRGYGGNEGSPSEAGFYEDARSYIKFLENDKHVKPENLILYGESLGTGVAVQMATEFQVSSVILETPYSSLYDIAKRNYFFVPVDWMLKDRYMSRDKIAKINAPLLVLHGHRDDVIPFEFAKFLYNSAVEPKTLIEFPEGTHHNLYALGAAHKILEFLDSVKDGKYLESNE